MKVKTVKILYALAYNALACQFLSATKDISMCTIDLSMEKLSFICCKNKLALINI